MLIPIISRAPLLVLSDLLDAGAKPCQMEARSQFSFVLRRLLFFAGAIEYMLISSSLTYAIGIGEHGLMVGEEHRFRVRGLQNGGTVMPFIDGHQRYIERDPALVDFAGQVAPVLLAEWAEGDRRGKNEEEQLPEEGV